jgi:hypothetical protein
MRTTTCGRRMRPRIVKRMVGFALSDRTVACFTSPTSCWTRSRNHRASDLLGAARYVGRARVVPTLRLFVGAKRKRVHRSREDAWATARRCCGLAGCGENGRRPIFTQSCVSGGGPRSSSARRGEGLEQTLQKRSRRGEKRRSRFHLSPLAGCGENGRRPIFTQSCVSGGGPRSSSARRGEGLEQTLQKRSRRGEKRRSRFHLSLLGVLCRPRLWPGRFDLQSN